MDDKRDDEQPGTSTAPAKGRGRGRQHGRENRCRSRSPCDRSSQPHHSPQAWRTESEPDTAPGVSRFMHHRPPGAQVDMHSVYTPKDVFQLFFSTATVKTLCKNTNKYAAIQQEMGKKDNWADVEVEELYKFFGLLMYMALVSLPCLQDYWRQNHILSFALFRNPSQSVNGRPVI